MAYWRGRSFSKDVVPFAVSVFFHGALLFVFRSSIPAETPLPPGGVPLELVEAPETFSSRRGGSRTGRKLSLKDLLPGRGDPLRMLKPLDGDSGSRSESGSGGFQSPMGLAEYAPLIPFLEAFWRRVDAAVEYPDDFAKQRIEGKVWVRLSVDGNGLMRDDFLRIESEHSWLRAYVLGILLSVLKEPLPRGKWTSREPLRLSLLFDFQTTPDRKPVYRVSQYQGHSLTFVRRAYAEPLLMDKLDQFMKYLPPVMPLGGVFIDFVRLYRLIEAISKPTELELREDRLKVFREKAHHLF